MTPEGLPPGPDEHQPRLILAGDLVNLILDSGVEGMSGNDPPGRLAREGRAGSGKTYREQKREQQNSTSGGV
jgi:hypothetical protein